MSDTSSWAVQEPTGEESAPAEPTWIPKAPGESIEPVESSEEADHREGIESWATPAGPAAESSREIRRNEQLGVEAELRYARHVEDAEKGISADESDRLHEMPPQLTSKMSIMDRLPEVDKNGLIREETRYSAPDSTPAKTEKQTAVDAEGDRSLELYKEAQAQVLARNEYDEPGMDAAIDERLMDAGRDHTASELRDAIGESTRLYEVNNPDFSVRAQAAQFKYAEERSAFYQSQGHSREASMKAGYADSEGMVYYIASEAKVQGVNVAQALDQAASNFLAEQGQKQSAGEAHAKSIQAGQRAAKGLSKSGGAGVAGKGRTSEEISQIEDPEEHSRAYSQWVEEQTNIFTNP